jgi:hypothetical protein
MHLHLHKIELIVVGPERNARLRSHATIAAAHFTPIGHNRQTAKKGQDEPAPAAASTPSPFREAMPNLSRAAAAALSRSCASPRYPDTKSPRPSCNRRQHTHATKAEFLASFYQISNHDGTATRRRIDKNRRVRPSHQTHIELIAHRQSLCQPITFGHARWPKIVVEISRRLWYVQFCASDRCSESVMRSSSRREFLISPREK